MIEDIDLHKPSAFDQRFERHYQHSSTYREAYQKAEQDYKAVFGERKYSSYNSFRNAYNSRNRVKK